MNIDKIHSVMKFGDTFLYSVFKDFVNSSYSEKEFKLFHYYLFRTDVLLNSINKRELFFFDENADYIIDGKINYKSKAVKKYVDDNKQLYVGNAFLSNYGYCPLFFYCKIRKEEYCLPTIFISGYSINTRTDECSYVYDKENRKELSIINRSHLNFSILYASDELRDNLDKLLKNTYFKNLEKER